MKVLMTKERNANINFLLFLFFAGITGILMSAAGLPVCLTRPPKLVLHPPPVSKSDIKPVPGLGHCCRKTTKKQARKGQNTHLVYTSSENKHFHIKWTDWQFNQVLNQGSVVTVSALIPHETAWRQYLNDNVVGGTLEI